MTPSLVGIVSSWIGVDIFSLSIPIACLFRDGHMIGQFRLHARR